MKVMTRILILLLLFLGGLAVLWRIGRREHSSDIPWKRALAEKQVVRLEHPAESNRPRQAAAPPPPNAVEVDAFRVPPEPAGQPVVAPPRETTQPPVEKSEPKTDQIARDDAPETASPIEKAARTIRRSHERLLQIAGYQGVMLLEDPTLKPPRRVKLRWRVSRKDDRALVEWIEPAIPGRKVSFFPSKPAEQMVLLLGAAEAKEGERRQVVQPHYQKIREECGAMLPHLGLDAWIKSMERAVRAAQMGDRRFGTLVFVGPEKTARADKPMILLRQTGDLAARLADLPIGGRRDWYFDIETQLPTLVVVYDADGKEVYVEQLQDLQLDAVLAPADLIIP